MPRDLNTFVYRPIETWPGTFTSDRKASQFSSEWRQTLRLLSDEVDHLTDRKDETGLLAHVRTEHPGVIVSFESDRGPLTFSCDRFDDGWRGKAGWRDNVRAIALALEALRKIDRYGIGQGGEQYTGFGALPPGQPMAMGATMSIDQAAELLSAHSIESPLSGRRIWTTAQVLTDPDAVRSAYRIAAKTHHPDAGGDPDTFRRLTEARDLLLGGGA